MSNLDKSNFNNPFPPDSKRSSVFDKQCEYLGTDSKVAPTNCKHINKRITRSLSKKWLKTSGYDENVRETPNTNSFVLAKALSTGVLTRTQYQSLLQNVPHPDLYKSLRCLSLNKKGNSVHDRSSLTSDYGTASESSKNCSVVAEISPMSSLTSDRDRTSHVAFESSDDEGFSVNSESGVNKEHTLLDEDLDQKRMSLSNTGWDSDVDEQPNSDWDLVDTEDNLRHLNVKIGVTLLRSGDVTAIIPNANLSNYHGEFKVHLKTGEESEFYRQGLCCGMRIHHVSPVVSMEPHGIQFYDKFPAFLIIPLGVEPQEEAWLSCLCSNTSDNQPPCWRRLPKKHYTYSNGRLIVTAAHFSLFTVILEEPYPEVMKHIRRRTGGVLKIAEVPGVKVEFPRGCLTQDVDAYLRVLYDSEPTMERSQRALASPVIMLGPHGYQFDPNRQPVFITVPVPHYHQIIARFGSRAKLTVWQSKTQEGEPLIWEPLNVPLTLPSVDHSYALPEVSFPVHHFSFFKVLWDILSTSLYECKMGMSYFYPYISFSMMCQAFMEESHGTNRFALEIICYRSDKRLPEATNYRHRVGASLKPKLVRPGRIIVRLRSQMFEADVEAGEDKDMVKEEQDFRGRDFEKQYACRFKPNANVDRGTFGKVIVERFLSNTSKDPLFEFNLHKSGVETEAAYPTNCDERWTVIAMRELASSLQITEGNNWKKFAQKIGFTKSEIQSKFQYSEDPFLAMMNLYNSRGGTPNEFIQALYEVSRDLRIGGSGITGSPSDGGNSSRSGGSRGSDSKASGSQDSGTPRRFGNLWGYAPWRQPASGSDSGDSIDKARKRVHTSSVKKGGSGGGSAPKRRKFSDISETISSSSDADNEGSDREIVSGNKSVSTEKHKNNPRKLGDRDLWRISSKIVRKDWRNLGRSLGIEEQVLVNLEHTHQNVGFRECAYQMLLEWKGRKPRKCTFGHLYSALLQEDMVAVAKHMVKTVKDDEPVEDSS